MAVDLPRGVVPVDPEGVHVAPRRLRQREARRGRVPDFVEEESVALPTSRRLAMSTRSKTSPHWPYRGLQGSETPSGAVSDLW